MNYKAKERAMPYHGATCVYCGRRMKASIHRFDRHLFPTREHVIPRSRGGGADTMIRVCLECNGLKDDMDPFEWIEFIARNRPSRLDAVCHRYAKIGIFRDGITGHDAANAAREYLRCEAA